MLITKRRHDDIVAEKDRIIALRRADIHSFDRANRELFEDNVLFRSAFPEDVRAIMATMRGDWAVPITEMATRASEESGLTITPARARDIVRALKALGLAKHGSTFDESTTAICGSGYFLSSLGSNVVSIFSGRP